MDDNAQLIRDIERFADRHGFSETGVGRFLTKAPNLMSRLREGKDILKSTEKQIRNKMKHYDTKVDALKQQMAKEDSSYGTET